ncbi:MAG: undecaprenyl-diphosphatase, partial [Pirellulaceae bacterium]|nr:undecaprenyl-diphosphatase [Pirellulaceae bacterium]
GAAIIAAIACGLTDRPKAAQFAFLVGIPTMFAAAGYELLKSLSAGGGSENWGELILAAVVSAVVGFFAVRWLVTFISGHSFVPFALYRMVLAVCLWLWL